MLDYDMLDIGMLDITASLFNTHSLFRNNIEAKQARMFDYGKCFQCNLIIEELLSIFTVYKFMLMCLKSILSHISINIGRSFPDYLYNQGPML
jgi:hypothetical protein